MTKMIGENNNSTFRPNKQRKIMDVQQKQTLHCENKSTYTKLDFDIQTIIFIRAFRPLQNQIRVSYFAVYVHDLLSIYVYRRMYQTYIHCRSNESKQKQLPYVQSAMEISVADLVQIRCKCVRVRKRQRDKEGVRERVLQNSPGSLTLTECSPFRISIYFIQFCSQFPQ